MDNNFSFLSNNDINKVIFSYSGSVNMTVSSSFDVSTGDIDELMLTHVIVSLDNDSWYASEMPPQSPTTNSDLVEIDAYSAAGRIHLFILTPGNFAQKTVYYKVLGIRV